MAIAESQNTSNSTAFRSPLRYPGGKRKLANFISLIFHYNDLLDGEYIELYAGGASVALKLLFDEYVRRIHINDIDKGVYAFWHSVLNETEDLCRLVRDTQVSMDVWNQQKRVQSASCQSLLELGFSTFFLNRTNRSGIISAGVIGGKNQTGKWKLDARYNKEDLIVRIAKIARYRERINLYNEDAVTLLRDIIPHFGPRTLLYLDPPYYVKGKRLLYTNYYRPEDHQELAKLVGSLRHKWIVSYDDVPEIRMLYSEYPFVDYTIHYSAQERYRGSEIMFFSPDLDLPDMQNPVSLRADVLQRYLL